MAEPPDPRQNRLLARLPDAEWQRWAPQLELVDLPLGMALYESGALPAHVYFPTTAVVSLRHVLDGGDLAEIAVVGFEGMVGISIMLGGGSAPSQAVVQSAGQGYRLQADAFQAEFERSSPVMHLMLRYSQALITQMSQTALCHRHHSLEKQFVRWLLLCLDRLHGSDVVMTQELDSNLPGVRRAGFTEAALHLQAAGIVRCALGHVRVLDRPGLEARCCECYRVIRQEYDRLLPDLDAGWCGVDSTG